jgi:hypothetical protein
VLFKQCMSLGGRELAFEDEDPEPVAAGQSPTYGHSQRPCPLKIEHRRTVGGCLREDLGLTLDTWKSRRDRRGAVDANGKGRRVRRR